MWSTSTYEGREENGSIFPPLFFTSNSHIYERMKKVSQKRYRPPPRKKLPKNYNVIGMSAPKQKAMTKMLNKWHEELRRAGLIHWNRKMGMKKLKEMFPDVYERELSELHVCPPETRTEEALQL